MSRGLGDVYKRQVEMGTDMAVIQAYMGHKNITTTQIYSKMAAQQMCEVVDKITLKRKEA